MSPHFTNALAGVLLGTALAGCPGSPPREAWTPEPWITTRVKIALLTTPEVEDSLRINVDTIDGRVTLHGTVANAAGRKAAEAAASGVTGVTRVRNLLQVVPPESRRSIREDDEEIRRDVAKALGDDPRIAKSDIRLDSVLKGLVRLAGSATNEGIHLRAIRAARDVPGVRAVATDVVVDRPNLSETLWSEHELAADGRQIGGVMRDAWITAEAKLRLLAEPRVPALEVNVDTVEGGVTLFGIVPSADARTAAAEAVRRVKGVDTVTNDLQVVSSSRKKAVDADDREILRAVREHLGELPAVPAASVRIEVHKGVVRLTGSVPTAEHRLRLATEARRVPGVRAVEADLELRRMTRPAE